MSDRPKRIAWQARVTPELLLELRKLHRELPGGTTLADTLEKALKAGIAEVRRRAKRPNA